MHKYVRIYVPFLIYFVCVAFAYFFFFSLLPKYDAGLGILGFLVIYTYISFGVFFMGYFMGKIIARRMDCVNIRLSLNYAIISFFLMVLLGLLKNFFYDGMYCNFEYTLSYFLDSLSDKETLLVSIGTLIPFLIGEFVVFWSISHNRDKVL